MRGWGLRKDPVLLRELDNLVEDFERPGEIHPHITIVILRNLALSLSRKLRKSNREISVFDY